MLVSTNRRTIGHTPFSGYQAWWKSLFLDPTSSACSVMVSLSSLDQMVALLNQFFQPATYASRPVLCWNVSHAACLVAESFMKLSSSVGLKSEDLLCKNCNSFSDCVRP